MAPEADSESLPSERPYRSHLRPACLACRKRKSRCNVDRSGGSCLTCRAHGTQCEFPPAPDGASPRPKTTWRNVQAGRSKDLGHRASAASSPHPSARTLSSELNYNHQTNQLSLAEASRRKSKSSDGQPPLCSPKDKRYPEPIGDGGEDEAHIVGPADIEDTQVLSTYLSNDSSALIRSRISVTSPRRDHGGGTRKPVVFTTVRKQPIGLPDDRNPAFLKCQMIEKLLEPMLHDVVELFFEKPNRCFPLLDRQSFEKRFVEDRRHISPALLSSLYAHTMTYWAQSPSLVIQHRPDTRFIWNQANDALYSEIHLSPGISTLLAILLNISGRPLTSIIGNGLQLGSAISLAHSLGLNRDSSDWNIPEAEKLLRTKIWWAIFVYDKWSSLAYGTPPQLRSGQHDVSLPTVEQLCGPAPNPVDYEATSVYLAFVALARFLDRYLERIYDLEKTSTTGPWDLEVLLTQWEDSLENNIRRRIIRGGESLDIPGSANLRLAYLYIRLLLRKWELDAEKPANADNTSSIPMRCYLEVRRAAEEIVLLVQELKDLQLGDYWLPLLTFAFTSTTKFLLRCALETENTISGLAQSMSLKLARDLIDALQVHRQKAWDVGDLCIAQYSEVIEKLATSTSSANVSEQPVNMPELQEYVSASTLAVKLRDFGGWAASTDTSESYFRHGLRLINPASSNFTLDSGADIAFNLQVSKSVDTITPIPTPSPEKDSAWCFPDTEEGVLDAVKKGATHLWANTILFASHPIQTSRSLGSVQDTLKVIGHGPLVVEKYDDKEYVNNLLRSIGGFTMPRSWTVHSSPTVGVKLRQLSLPFPLVAKPIRGRGSHGVRVCQNLEDLTAHAETLFKESPSIMLEEYLAGEEATITVMPPNEGKNDYWSLPIVTRFNHQHGIAPYNGVVAVTANSRVITKEEEQEDTAYDRIARECEAAARVLSVAAPIRIDVRRFDETPGSRFALFDVNMKPNMTGPGRPGRDDQASLTLLAAEALGWDYPELLRQVLNTSSTLKTLRELKPREN
ncbi:fungal specific transcription factor domain-containing protein [Colletotrichum orchidophilum]|uniref:Fungal specific transcription factor domain-containing protein n=1 Tax=Colletotrichum orchidophilum TaxID=1209926 RepID=A0A1G4BSD8_9PEZI|nr:fungal specific transcription factor domain-containing protein [Colletotrichum orchidophilum]OHF04245.1 fungal specific transcription factor domain-containing protein [Colletotrichum orchidophilum]